MSFARVNWMCILGVVALAAAPAMAADDAALFSGKPLTYWADQATAESGPADLDTTVAALTEAVLSEDPNAKRDAGDALATLGPKAKAALPALLEQFGHPFPWVRVSCQAAVGSMGKEAVPALINTMKTTTGGPRLRACFVLGGIGADAKPAVPVIAELMKEESPVMQERFLGVLRSLDPENYPPPGTNAKAQYEGSSDQSLADVDTSDWPQFHGPLRDNICRETGLLKEWPEGGPKQLSTFSGLGRGYSTVAISGGKLFTMGDLKDAEGEEAQYVLAYDLQSGKRLWNAQIGPAHVDGGPRCTPTLDGDALYAIGTDGDLVCLDAATGQLRWAKNFVNDFEGQFMAVWKFSESPLIDGDRLICTPGGPEATMVALNKQTGEVIWKCAMPEIGTGGVDGCGYSSAVAAEICGVRQYVQLVGRGVIGVEAATGRFLWGYNPVANTVANITSPIVRGDYVFATTAYNTGSALLKIVKDGDGFAAEEVYFISPRDFQNHHGGVVMLGDYIYGGHGPNRGDPACIKVATGEVVWKERGPARGSAGVLYADGNLIYRYDRGEVVMMAASPEGMKITGRFTAPDEEGPAWAHPVIHNGILYLRHNDSLFRYDVSAQ